MSAKNPQLKIALSLGEAYKRYHELRSAAREFGGIELSCPTCKEPTAVEDVDCCEHCGGYCCPACTTHGEDCNVCEKCLKAAVRG